MKELIVKAVGKVDQLSNQLGLGFYVEFQSGKPQVWSKKWANGDRTGKLGWFFWAKSKRPVGR